MALKVMPRSCSVREMASFLMPRIGDGKNAVMIAGELNDDGNSAVTVDTTSATAKCRRGDFRTVDMTAFCRHAV